MNKEMKQIGENSQIVLYQPDESIKLEVKVKGDFSTVWLSIDQMAVLFGRDKSVIGKHVRSIFKEGELLKESVWAKFAYTASDGKTYQVDYYNLDVIISAGTRSMLQVDTNSLPSRSWDADRIRYSGKWNKAC